MSLQTQGRKEAQGKKRGEEVDKVKGKDTEKDITKVCNVIESLCYVILKVVLNELNERQMGNHTLEGF